MSEFAKRVRLDQIVAAKPQAVSVTTDTTVEATAKLLAKKNFRSVPVWDEEEGRFVGFIDEMDLLEYAVVYAHAAFEKGELHIEHLREKYSQFTPEELKRLSFGSGTVESILRLPGAHRRRIFVFQSNALLSNAMQIIKDHERVLVQHVVKPFSDSKSRMFLGRLMTRTHRSTQVKICSQTDVLRYLFAHSSELREDSLYSLTVANCGALGAMTSITVEERAIDGFLKMLDAKVDACAVVDRGGRLVASLSASDLRGMTSENLSTILLPVMEFFPAMTGARAPAPLVCVAQDLLLDTVRKILKASTRRCWMVDGEYRPVGLVSMGKIIYCALANPCQHM
jgi:CBS domain-containing protein